VLLLALLVVWVAASVPLALVTGPLLRRHASVPDPSVMAERQPVI
jgi:hypothetical protein